MIRQWRPWYPTASPTVSSLKTKKTIVSDTVEVETPEEELATSNSKSSHKDMSESEMKQHFNSLQVVE